MREFPSLIPQISKRNPSLVRNFAGFLYIYLCFSLPYAQGGRLICLVTELDTPYTRNLLPFGREILCNPCINYVKVEAMNDHSQPMTMGSLLIFFSCITTANSVSLDLTGLWHRSEPEMGKRSCPCNSGLLLHSDIRPASGSFMGVV